MKKRFSKIWKKNQIMITALACMIAIAGYLNFTGKQLEDETLYTTSAQFEEIPTVENTETASELYDISEEDMEATADIESLDSDLDMASMEEELEMVQGAEAGETPGEAVLTSTTGITSLAEANLLKEQTRVQNKEALLEIINNTNLSESAKVEAVNSMIAMTEVAQKECDAEILLEAKGFENAVVSISGESVDVMIGAMELTDAQRAQIEDIVKRKTGILAENIIISPVGKNE